MTNGVWHNGNDWVVASGATEALGVWCLHTGEDESDYSAGDWEREPDDKVLKVVDDDGNRDAKTCADWAKDGPQYLFSRDW